MAGRQFLPESVKVCLSPADATLVVIEKYKSRPNGGGGREC